MLADCDRCALRDIACADCVITVLPGGQAGLGEEERRALRVLARAGLVLPLRFAAGPAAVPVPAAADPAAAGPALPGPAAVPVPTAAGPASTGPAFPGPSGVPVPAAAAPAAATLMPAGRRRAPGAGRSRSARGPGPASPIRPARHRIEIVKPGPSVGEAVETALALH